MLKNKINPILIFIFLIITIGNILNIEPYTVGLTYDDGVYVSLAKSLAEGRGYTSIYRIDPPTHVYFLPLYPFFLSLIWRIYPYFPDNILFLKLLSISAFFVFLIFTFLFLKRLLLKDVFIYTTMILLVSCVSVYQHSNCVNIDMFYAALQFLFLYIIYKINKTVNTRYSPFFFLWAVSISSVFLFYTRPLGITFYFAWIVYFLIKREFKYTIIYCAIVFVAASPWLLHILNNIETSYIEGLLDKSNRYYLSFNTIFPIIFKNLKNIILVSIPMYVFPSIYSKFVITNFATANFIIIKIIFCLFISALTIYGFIYLFRREIFILSYVICYLGLILVWHWETTRFLLPLAPFIIFSFFMGFYILIERISALLHFERYKFKFFHWAYFMFFFIILIGNLIRASDLFAYNNFSLIKKKSHPHKAVFEWIKNNTKGDDRIATTFDAMYYLYTDRKTIIYLNKNYENNLKLFKEVLDLNNISYIVQTHYSIDNITEIHYFIYDRTEDFGYKIITELNRNYPSFLTEVFQDTHTGVVIHKIKK